MFAISITVWKLFLVNSLKNKTVPFINQVKPMFFQDMSEEDQLADTYTSSDRAGNKIAVIANEYILKFQLLQI